MLANYAVDGALLRTENGTLQLLIFGYRVTQSILTYYRQTATTPLKRFDPNPLQVPRGTNFAQDGEAA
jgi:hypothetical protein